MPLHHELTEKSLQLPEAPEEESRLAEKRLAFLQTIYKAAPNYLWVNSHTFQTTPYFKQLLDTLLPAYEKLSALYGVKPKGFRLFVRKFKGGRSQYDDNNPYPTSDPYNKPNIVYASIKDYLEKIYYKLNTTSSMTPGEIKKQLAFLSQQLALCGPGVFETLQTIEHDLNQKDGILYWLEETRDTIAESVAAELFEHRIKPRERLRDWHYDERWYDANYRSHAHSFVERLAKHCGFPLFKSEALTTFHDQHEKGLYITESDRQWVRKQLFKRYTPDLIVRSLSTTLCGRFSDFKQLNLRDETVEKKFNQLTAPFIDENIFSLQDITIDMGSERILNPDIYSHLPSYCQQLMLQLGYFKRPGIECLKTIIHTLENHYHSTLSYREKSQPNSKRVQSIKHIVLALSAILRNPFLSDEEKVDAAYGLLQTHIDEINAEHNVIRQWSKAPFRLIHFPLFETRLEMILNNFLSQLTPRAGHHPKLYYQSITPLINAQLTVLRQNQDIKHVCHQFLQDHFTGTDNQTLCSLADFVFAQKASGEDPFSPSIDKTPIVLSLPSDEEILDTLNDQAVFWTAKNAIYFKSHLVDHYGSLYKTLLQSRPILEKDIDRTVLKKLFVLRRLISLSEEDRLVLHASSQTAEAIGAILQLDIALITNYPEPLLNLIQAKHLTPSHIQLLNDFIHQGAAQRDAHAKLQFILQQDIDISHLPLLSTLDTHYFTPRALPVFHTLFSMPEEKKAPFITILNQCMRQNPDTCLPILLQFLAYPELNVEKLPSLLDFQPEIYFIEDGIKLLCQFQDELPLKQEHLIELINALKPPLKPAVPSPQGIQEALRKRLPQALTSLARLLSKITPEQLLDKSLIEELKGFNGIIPDTFTGSRPVVKEQRSPTMPVTHPPSTSGSQAGALSFFSTQRLRDAFSSWRNIEAFTKPQPYTGPQ